MASFGGSKDKKADAIFKQAQSSMGQNGTPYSFDILGGKTSAKKGKVSYKRKLNANERKQRALANTKLVDVLSNLPTAFDPQSTFDNPFYGTANGLMQDAIDRQYQDDSKKLQNDLNARNQIGSSYDAYSRFLMDQNYNNRRDDASKNARMMAADEYHRGIQDLFGALSGLRNERSAQYNMQLLPFQLATGYQNAVTPLQTAMIGANSGLAGQRMQGMYSNPTLMDNLLNYWKGNASVLAGMMGA